MKGKELPSSGEHIETKEELLRELEDVHKRILPYLETALAYDEIHKFDILLDERNSILYELDKHCHDFDLSEYLYYT